MIVATGGVPNFGPASGSELCLSVWDVLASPLQAKADVLIYDATGRHPAPSAAAQLAAAGHAVTFVARDPSLAPEMEHHSSITYRKAMAERDVQVILEHELVSVALIGDRREVVLRHLLTGRETRSTHDQVVVEHGTVPVTDLFDELRPRSVNDGVTDISTLIGSAPLRQPPAAGFELHRIGDAISSRSVHAAMLDALRLGVQF
ncbi:FAD-dependent oxidoreductase [Rhizobium sp. SAFR-030]|uniref:FAD-dependent oxidoreductase n=1 Tax=Rhizobium sp. SAFR-030 TaxID=3387277 RepID=UPI003F80DB0B